MITNERQYKITKGQADKFRAAIKNFDELEMVRQGIDPVIIEAQREALKAQLAELESELENFRRLRSNRIKRLFPATLADIGSSLIEARITQSLSQKQLASRLDMKEQQIQRYEQDRYLTANLTRIAEIADALGLDLHAFFEVRERSLLDKIAPNLQSLNDFDVTKLPVKRLREWGWLDSVRIPNSGEDVTDLELAAAFISQSISDTEHRALYRQRVKTGSNTNEHAILAWKARALSVARRMTGELPQWQTLDPSEIQTLVSFSTLPDGAKKAVHLLRSKGIAVVFVRHLPETHLDGAAMILNEKVPVIAMTLRYDRMDNFWFVLLHELGHIALHWEECLKGGCFDDEMAPAEDEVERAADAFAQSALIPNEIWRNSFVRFTTSTDEVVKFAKTNKIGVSIVAGRIRRERNKYTLFGNLVGQGEVRKQLSEAGLWES